MDYLLFSKAIFVGFAIAAPVGPIGLICIQRTLIQGSKSGLASGFGAATADAIYGAIGAFSLTALTHVLTSAAKPLAIFGIIFLIWLGVKFLRSDNQNQVTQEVLSNNALVSFVSTFLLTIANPITILSFIAVFASMGGNMSLDTGSAGIMVLGVFLGSVVWWLSLVAVVTLIKHKINSDTLKWISRTAGIFLLGFAGWQLMVLIQ
ncbi:MAG: LysE family transporter [Gammaproteobacteria bacterium]|nr:LysE family transporter [Gammaproteobacteria bacterium]MBT3724699.1 LysE family transporter [Gammaproteobacteria bacterium]MBT4192804.1 LysE family transporter [Gammaproteobacteria bacterium]MBT4448725.1 LysE family transporter [Gammaproteobacteria bacterium]MBT4862609.1 LysE family transporter [Gammaproteobacteria bacterium]